MKMLSATEIVRQIQTLTADLISMGLCINQTFPSLRKIGNDIEEISVTGCDTSIFLKHMPYEQMYSNALKNKYFNFQMQDNAIGLMQYRFCGGELINHRLCFFPSPNFGIPEVLNDYDEQGCWIEIQQDIRVVPAPFRFDFDSSDENHKPIVHPKSHFTFGQLPDCRIPVTSAVTPYQFVMFIVSNFYPSAYAESVNKLTKIKSAFDESIHNDERCNLLHFATPTFL